MFTNFQEAINGLDIPKFIKYALIGQELYNLGIFKEDNYHYNHKDGYECRMRDAIRDGLK